MLTLAKQSSVTAITQWGEINHNARYDRTTGLYYFECRPHAWMNYEPNMVKYAYSNKPGKTKFIRYPNN